VSRRTRRPAGAIDTSTPEGAALLAWMHPSDEEPTVEQPTTPTPVPGQYAELEVPSNVLGSTERMRAVVLITSADERAGEGYVYVGWTNAQPGGGWDRNLGSWGFFRHYPEPRPHGTRLLRLLPVRAVASPTGWRDQDAPAGAGEEVEAYRG
jgi:hypothetical protein